MSDKNTLLNLISNLLPDNTSGEISPSDIRTVLSNMVTSDLNLDELSPQEVAGLVDFLTSPTDNGASLLGDAPNDGENYIRNGGQWTRKASLLASSNATIAINGSAANPSFLSIDDMDDSVGITLTNGATGTVQNTSGRALKAMVGSISFYPDVSGGGTKRLVIVSETSSDNVAWVGNINSIRKVEIGSSSETFKTTVSLVNDWEPSHYLRFRFFDETGVGLDLVAVTGETILGQTFTGPSMIWSLVES